jgi:hypothetical protein
LTNPFGRPQVASLAIQTSDVGRVVGVGIIFESVKHADAFLDHMLDYFETPSGVPRRFMVFFRDRGSHCDLAIDVQTRSSTKSVEISDADHRVLDDLISTLEQRPYYFIIACVSDGQDGVLPYKADQSILFQSRFFLDGKEVSGNTSGGWTREKLFTA